MPFLSLFCLRLNRVEEFFEYASILFRLPAERCVRGVFYDLQFPTGHLFLKLPHGFRSRLIELAGHEQDRDLNS
jgi:hypothetical protein